MEKRKIGISDFGFKTQLGWEKSLELIKKSGFDTVDFNLESYMLSDEVYGGSEDAFVSHFTAIKEKAADLELEIAQTHGRCSTYAPNNESHNKWVKDISEKDLRATAILGAPSCVIHSINCSAWGKIDPEVLHAESKKMYDDLIPFAEKNKVNISLETFGAAILRGSRICDLFSYPSEITRQYESMDTEYKTICLDSGHTHEVGSFWVPPVEDMIRALGNKISLTHLHDNMGVRDDHLLPGMGNINWPAVFDAFEEVGYKGTYNFELRTAFWGSMMEDGIEFMGKYLRRFVDGHGKI